MDLPSEAINEFKEIFQGEFKRLISDDEARERAEGFMRVVFLIIRPLSSSADPDTRESTSAAVDEGSLGYHRKSGQRLSLQNRPQDKCSGQEFLLLDS